MDWFLHYSNTGLNGLTKLQQILGDKYYHATFEIKDSRMDQVNLRKTVFKKLKDYGLLKTYHTHSNFLKDVFHKFCLVHCWILCPICMSSSLNVHSVEGIHDHSFLDHWQFPQRLQIFCLALYTHLFTRILNWFLFVSFDLNFCRYFSIKNIIPSNTVCP